MQLKYTEGAKIPGVLAETHTHFHLQTGFNTVVPETQLYAKFEVSSFNGFRNKLCPKKVYPLIFYNNFGKYGPIFKIFSPGDS